MGLYPPQSLFIDGFTEEPKAVDAMLAKVGVHFLPMVTDLLLERAPTERLRLMVASKLQ